MRTRIKALCAAALAVAWTASCAPAPPPPLEDTPEARAEQAAAVATMEMEGGSLEETLDLGSDLALASSQTRIELDLGRPLTDDEVESARAVMRDSLAEILTPEVYGAALADAYAAHFTADELAAIAEFFSSPVGSKILDLQAELTADIGDAAEAAVDAELESFAEMVDARLAAELGTADEEGE